MRPFFLTVKLASVKVLLVEDNPGDARLIQETLAENKDLQFDVTVADRLSAALSHLGRGDVDVILLDLGLPDTTGLETLLKMREARAHIPVVVLTGRDDEKLAAKAIQHGALDYLLKDSLEGGLLAYAVSHAIERHHLNAKIEQLRQQQIEKQKLEGLGILAGGIAHDFNNLLTIVMGRADLALMETRTPPSVKNSLTQIKSASSRAADLCRQLLAYSGRGRFVPLLFNLSDVLKDMAPYLQRAVLGNVSFKYDLAETLPLVKADIAQLRQAIMNLILNAAEAIGSGQGTISIRNGLLYADRDRLAQTRWGVDLPEGKYVYLEISDTGCGMDSQTQTRIFEPFFSTKFMGRGLGLSAVFGIVRAHRGTMEVVSKKGDGSIFRILFPPSQIREPVQLETKGAPEGWRGEGTVLVMDSDEEIRRMIGQMVEQIGFKTFPAADGVTGVEIFRKHEGEIVLVLLNLMMARMKGTEVFAAIRRLKADACILLMGDDTDQEVIHTHTGKEFTGFVRKPFKFTELRDKIHALLESRPISPQRP